MRTYLLSAGNGWRIRRTIPKRFIPLPNVKTVQAESRPVMAAGSSKDFKPHKGRGEELASLHPTEAQCVGGNLSALTSRVSHTAKHKRIKMKTNQTEKARPVIIDECEDANGHFTIRYHDGSKNGDINVQPLATVYGLKSADRIVRAVNEHAALVAVAEAAEALRQDYHEGIKKGWRLPAMNLLILNLEKKQANLAAVRGGGVK